MDQAKIEKLKARAYDLMATMQRCQQQLQQINAEIAKESQPLIQQVAALPTVGRAERRRLKKSA